MNVEGWMVKAAIMVSQFLWDATKSYLQTDEGQRAVRELEASLEGTSFDLTPNDDSRGALGFTSVETPAVRDTEREYKIETSIGSTVVDKESYDAFHAGQITDMEKFTSEWLNGEHQGEPTTAQKKRGLDRQQKAAKKARY
jgi:hypothetical protein